jgi:uncharacterized membrane protein
MPKEARAPAVVAENIEKILRAESAALRPSRLSEVAADRIGSFAGTLYFVVLQTVGVLAWMLVNTGCVPGIAVFDPLPCPLLSTVNSVEAVLLAAFVLIKQNRMGAVADRRAHLDLQVNLLTERETTHLIRMVDRLSERFGVEQHQDAETHELRESVSVENLVQVIERRISGGGEPPEASKHG